MEIGEKYNFSNGQTGILIEKSKNKKYGLFEFKDGAKYVFSINTLNFLINNKLNK